MNTDAFNWNSGLPELKLHSRSKLKILEEYCRDYITIRCSDMRVREFRLAVVDGFAGGGFYKCGRYGSPLIFLKTLSETINNINNERRKNGIINSVKLVCLFIFNDKSKKTIEILKEKIMDEIAIFENEYFVPDFKYFTSEFEKAYPEIKKEISEKKYNRNVIFNLDQKGYAYVSNETLYDILYEYHSCEIILTFMVGALERFISKDDLEYNIKNLSQHGLTLSDIRSIMDGDKDIDMLSNLETLLLNNFLSRKNYVSPFSINNPDGYHYWLIHLSKQQRAREAHNYVLHNNATILGHFGHIGFERLLGYDPRYDNTFYEFTKSHRKDAREALLCDIPKYLYNIDDILSVEEFLSRIYNYTPASTEDLKWAMYNSSEVNVFNSNNKKRRVPNTISGSDLIVPVAQRKLYFPTDKSFVTKKRKLNT